MTKKKKNIRFRTVLFFLLFGYLVIMCAYYIYKLPIKNIYITGNSLVSDQDIIDAANLKSYPSIHKYSRRKIAKNIKQLDLINDVKVKKNIFGKVTIIVDEAKPIFYYRTDDKAQNKSDGSKVSRGDITYQGHSEAHCKSHKHTHFSSGFFHIHKCTSCVFPIN